MRTVGLALLALAGCIDEFQGSNIQVDFSSAMPAQASAQAMAPVMGELPNDIHFTLYAFQDATDANDIPVGHLFELQQFEIHRIVDLSSPCFIDVGAHVPFPGLHVSQFAEKMMEDRAILDISNPPPGRSEEDLTDVATAIQRQTNVGALASEQGPKVVSSASSGGYLDVAADCNGGAGIPPPQCTDDASNRRRLQLCQDSWDDDPSLFEGTDRILTSPLNGTTHGMVDGVNPVNFAPVGGAQFFVDEGLDDFDGFAVYYVADSAPDDDLGTLLLFGRPESITRGVIRVPMTSLISPAITATLAIFANIDEDEVQF